ncbi:hypothetical protein Vretimale_3109 [Volvox reticuliferus]|uniref:Uncharacterized protein n=1 Tax=Volvox reticuliferus TaxID=1737510 RepID=A0A8J4FLL3_9CHLO|nr:hypothetical protein Vretifemale_6705 [Volvox reticuliferus]GIL97464.1 hypothetical protein Vretimale_3109 [Volvox reticuliferus]
MIMSCSFSCKIKLSLQIIISCLFLGIGTKFSWLVYSQDCSPVRWSQGALPGYCTVFNSVCVDHGSRIVLHEERFQIDNIARENTPGLPIIRWNLPLRFGAFPDALGGWQPDFSIHVRPASKVEPTLPLRHPSWNNCTLPVVLLVDYPYDYKTFVVKALTDIDKIFRVRALAPEEDPTLVLATPAGLALEPYHAVLLSPYSRLPVATLAELGRRAMDGTLAEWSREGVRVHCFSQLLACKLDQQEGTAPHVAAAAVLTHLGDIVPTDPLDFGVLPPGVLRVVVEDRIGSWRTIRNVQQILGACKEADAKGFSAGGFTRIICKSLPVSYDTSPPAVGPISTASPAAAAFLAKVGAVRSAHLFVSMVGSNGAHAFFMDHDPANGGAGLVEVRPCRWGSEHASRADGAAEAMAAQLQRDDTIRFFAYNVEDASQCSPPDYERQLAAALATGQMKPQATAHNSQLKSSPRYTPEELLVRDQHVTLRPGTLMAMLRHAASLLHDKVAYQSARSMNRLHGYAVPEGLLLGPLGLRNAAAQTSGYELIRET